MIIEAENPEAAESVREQATRLGVPSTSGTHADGTWIEFLDPDGIALRIVHTPTPTESFLGVTFGPNGQQGFYDEPKLDVSKLSVGASGFAAGTDFRRILTARARVSHARVLRHEH